MVSPSYQPSPQVTTDPGFFMSLVQMCWVSGSIEYPNQNDSQHLQLRGWNLGRNFRNGDMNLKAGAPRGELGHESIQG